MTSDVLPIYQELRQEIESLQIVPGTRLGEIELTTRFGVSRTPIRDVLKKLEEDGLVRIVPKSGTYVTPLDMEGFEDEMFLRFSIETAVMKTLFGRLSENDIDVLRQILNEQKQTLTESENFRAPERFYGLDDAFHKAIYSFANKEGIYHRMQTKSPTFSRYRHVTFFRDIRYLSSLFSIHERLLEALVAQDGDALEAASREHNYSGLEGLAEVRKTHPTWFA